MSHEVGTYLGGIRHLGDLKERCFVERESGCWIWRGGMSHGYPSVGLCLGAGERSPAMRGQRAAQLLAGVEMSPKQIAHPYKCRNPLCVNPEHGGVKTRKQHGAWMRAKGLCKISVAHVAATIKRNKERAKVTPEMVEVMLSSDASCVELGRRFGVSASSVSNYRRGINGGGKAFHAASVFSWRPAA